jgi:hypothetical protein
MSSKNKKLVRRTDVVRKTDKTTDTTDEQTEQTEVDLAAHALAERMLFGSAPRRQAVQGQPRIILGLDCTSSMGEYITTRKISLADASVIANALFANAGPRLQVQLAFFRGYDSPSSKHTSEFHADKWYGTAAELAQAIAEVEHWSGWTQHCRLLRHAVAEADKQAVQQLVIFSDAFEGRTPLRPQGDDLQAACVHAKRFRDAGGSISIVYKGTIRGGCPLDRAGIRAEQAFAEITEANGGVLFLLDHDLTERVGEIGSQAALAAKGDAVSAHSAQALLEHLRTIPFEMDQNVVGVQVPNAKCGRDENT